ncbi:MAG: NADH-quinone oxidoreductase subunit J [Bacteroidaceae bacterium]|nr:NADH-quinone oxidoreductase subunit J [Bacteroidaceae bacterium]
MSINLIIFSGLALVMVIAALFAVTSSKIMRATTLLLFVLFGTAGLYFMLHYTFLGAVQITVYAGGIVVLLIFVVLLLGKGSVDVTQTSMRRYLAGTVTAMTGMIITIYLINTTQFSQGTVNADGVAMRELGLALMGTEKFHYILPFEVMSVLLLACTVGAILIARKK